MNNINHSIFAGENLLKISKDTLIFLFLITCIQGFDSPSSSTPEEGDTEDDGQTVSITP